MTRVFNHIPKFGNIWTVLEMKIKRISYLQQIRCYHNHQPIPYFLYQSFLIDPYVAIIILEVKNQIKKLTKKMYIHQT